MHIRIRRVKVYSSGMRVADVSIHRRVALWAQHHNTHAASYIDPEDDNWVIVEFPDDKLTTLFVLSDRESLEILLCT